MASAWRMILELAEKFAHEKRTERSVAFAFWTLEEQGLLGSEYFGEHPLWPPRTLSACSMSMPMARRRIPMTWKRPAPASRKWKTC